MARRFRTTRTATLGTALGIVLGTTLAVAGCADTTGTGGHDDHSTTPGTSAGTDVTASDADVMFAQMMIPHHEQAVEMSGIVLAKDGVDERVVVLAEQIEAAQGPEIEQMTAMLDRWGADAGRADDHAEHMDGMLDDEAIAALEAAPGEEAQRLFLEGMVEHHEGAIAMAQDALADAEDPEVLALAEEIVATQQEEIDTMRDLLAEL